jgi:hypothetical protein
VSAKDLPVEAASAVESLESGQTDLLSPLLRGHVSRQDGHSPPSLTAGVIIGELLALADDGATPLVRYAGQPGSSALPARTTVDLHGLHIGAAIVLMFEHGDPERPLVLGVLRGQAEWPSADPPAQVSVDVDGQRMIVSAGEQLVLRCGRASITLTKAGKVLVEGTYVSSRSTGVNRIKGGSVQLN